MNETLAAVINRSLARLGPDRVGDWRHVVMVNSDAAVPALDAPAGISGRGFNLLLLSRSGRATYYVRCRRAADSASAHEAMVLARLASDPGLRGVLPEQGTAEEGGLRVQSSRYLHGTLMAKMLPGMPVVQWHERVAEVVALAREVGRAAVTLLPAPAAAEPTLSVLAEPALSRLSEWGLPSTLLAPLAGVLQASDSLPRHPQHGDLWPGNVMRCRDGWKLLDFEHFGLVTCPLYDACHLILTSADYLLTGGQGLTVPLARVIASNEQIAAGVRAILQREAAVYRLSERQAMAALVYHLVDITARLLGNGVGAEVLAPLKLELEAMAAATTGGTARELYFGRAGPGSS